MSEKIKIRELTDLEREEIFVGALAALSIQTGVFIDGCGCCGSPLLVHGGMNRFGTYTVDEDGLNLKWKDLLVGEC